MTEGIAMDANMWLEGLSEEQRAALADMDEDQIMDYLADEGVELPDEALESVAGGLPLGKLVAGWLKTKLEKYLQL